MMILDGATAWLGDRLLAGSLQACGVVLLVWLLCHRRFRLSPAMHAALWWLVALKLVMTLLPLPAVPIPILASPSVLPAPVVAVADPVVGHMASSTAVESVNRGIAGALGIWLFGVAWHGIRLVSSWRMARATRRRSTPWLGDLDDQIRIRQLAAIVGLTGVPRIHTSVDVTAPQVRGVWRPLVLMPADASLSPQDWLMALGHEFMHIRRRDLMFGLVPAVAERLFFFHPLARLAVHEYLIAREAACDAALVRALDVPAAEYGRLLVRFGIGGRRSVFAAGGASTSASILRRRLDMLQQMSNRGSRQWGWIAGVAMVVAIVPSHIVAQAPPDLPTPPALSQSTAVPRQPIASPPTEPEVRPELQREEVRESAQAEPSVRTEDFLRERLADVEKALSDIERQKLIERIARESELQKLVEQQARARTDVETALESNRMAEVMSQLRETERRLADSRRAQEQELQARLSDQSPAAREQVLREQLRELERSINLLSRRYQELQKQFEDLSKQYKAF